MQCENLKWVHPNSKPRGIQVPCGKCLSCLHAKRSDWSFRLMQEYKHCNSAAFITLTYHPKFVPDKGVTKRHLQLFMKRLRKKSGQRLRYYAVGEYGTKTGRPHYHLIIFNYVGNETFLSSIWSTRKGTPYGIVHIGRVTEASIVYCTKYIIQRGNQQNAQTHKPFMLCSRAFGIGLWYLSEDMAKWHRTNGINYTFIHGEKGRLPRYYKEKIWPDEYERSRISYQSKWDGIKAHRKNLALFYKMYGKDAQKKMTEFRNAVTSRMKEKIAFTQTI